MIKRPIAIIGATLDGLAAAWRLARYGVRVVVLAQGEEERPLALAGISAQPGACPIRTGTPVLKACLRDLGLEHEAVAPDGRLFRLVAAPDGVECHPAGFDPSARELRGGSGRLYDRLAARAEIWPCCGVSALRWDGPRDGFRFRSARTGRSLPWIESNRPFGAAGVIVATPLGPTVALAGASTPLAPVRDILGAIPSVPAWDFAFRVTRRARDAWAAHGGTGTGVAWAAFEHGGEVLAARVSEAATGSDTPDTRAHARAAYRVAREFLPGADGEPLEWVRGAHSVPIVPEGSRVRIAGTGIPTEPLGLPLAICGDYIGATGLEGRLASAVAAADSVMGR